MINEASIVARPLETSVRAVAWAGLTPVTSCPSDSAATTLPCAGATAPVNGVTVWSAGAMAFLAEGTS